MTTKLTEQERDIWTKVYMLHEIFHDCEWRQDDVFRFTEMISKQCAESGDHPLMIALQCGMADYFGEIIKEKQGRRVEQLCMLGGR